MSNDLKSSKSEYVTEVFGYTSSATDKRDQITFFGKVVMGDSINKHGPIYLFAVARKIPSES